MAKIVFAVVALCFLSVATAHFGSKSYLLQGCVYCDTCRCGFETPATKYLHGNHLSLSLSLAHFLIYILLDLEINYYCRFMILCVNACDSVFTLQIYFLFKKMHIDRIEESWQNLEISIQLLLVKNKNPNYRFYVFCTIIIDEC